MATGEDSPSALAAIDAAPCGLARTSEDGTFLRVNRTFCTWLGCERDALVGKRRFQDLLTMGGRIFHQTHWSPLLRMQGSVSEVKLEILGADQKPIPMVLNALRHEEHGVVVHELAAYVARDRDIYERELISSRKKLEALVIEANQLHAEAKDRALFAEQMVGIVSHDLRNPISSVIMGTSLLATDALSPAQLRIVERIRRSADRATRLIGDLLDFTQARLGSGLPVSPTAIDLHAVVADAIDELRVVYPERKLEHARIGSGTCVADADRLVQLLGNLVSNAMVHGPPDGTVTVTSCMEGDACSVAVHNDGKPIPKEVQSRVFEPMTRGVRATSAARSVGLGLYVVREIAKAHGGTAELESSEGAGTTVRVVFPKRC